MEPENDNVEAVLDEATPDSPTPQSEPTVFVGNAKPIHVSNQFWQLDPRSITVSMIVGIIFSSVLTLAALIGLLALWATLSFSWIWFSVAVGAMLICITMWILTFVWPSLEHKHACWRLDSEGLEIKRGVLWRHHITIPLGRVQHADVSQGPLQRIYDIGTLKVHTAGTQNASIELEGLAHIQALELRDLIVNQRKGEHVV